MDTQLFALRRNDILSLSWRPWSLTEHWRRRGLSVVSRIGRGWEFWRGTAPGFHIMNRAGVDGDNIGMWMDGDLNGRKMSGEAKSVTKLRSTHNYKAT